MKKNELMKTNQLPKNLDKMVPAMTFESGHIYTVDKGVVPINSGIFEGFDFSSDCDMKALNVISSEQEIKNRFRFNNAMNGAKSNKIKNIVDIYAVAINSRMRVLVVRACAPLAEYFNPNNIYEIVEDTCSYIQSMILTRYIITIRNIISMCYSQDNARGDIGVCLNSINIEMNSVCMDINNKIWCDVLNKKIIILPEKDINDIMGYYTSEFAKFMYDMLYETMTLVTNVGNIDMSNYITLDAGNSNPHGLVGIVDEDIDY